MVFVIAEAGSNWRVGSREKDLQMAYALIDAAADAGADAVKFQVFRAHSTYAPNCGACNHLTKKGMAQPIDEIFRDLEMPAEFVPQFSEHCIKRGVEFMASAFSEETFELIDPYVKRHKIASPELHYPRLLKLVNESGKPVYLSTGISTSDEIAWALSFLSNVTLLQCTVAYPTPPEAVNLRALETLKSFGHPVGLSDHTRDPILAPVGAVALGASVIEKHYTLHNRLVGPDHSWAITSEELTAMIKAVRAIEVMRGTGVKEIHPAEQSLRAFSGRGVQALRAIAEGEIFCEEGNISVLRPGQQTQGVHPRYLHDLSGKKATRPIAAGEGIQRGDWI